MDNYTSYFLGIPLTEKYQQSFEDLLKRILLINPYLKPTYSKTPHITVCYLNKQAQANLSKIAEKVKNYSEIIKGVELKIGGFNYFKGEESKILFLDVQYPEELEKFNEVVTKNLSIYSAADNNLPFHPHVTVARVENTNTQQSFKAHQSNLEAILDEVNWSFEITEVVLYGTNSTKQPEYQEKLISLAVK